jgi:hypothetical protein
MRTVRPCTASLFLFATLTVAAPAGPWKAIALPRTIQVRQEIRQIPDGWQAYSPQNWIRPVHISVFAGHPKESGSLAPDSSIRDAKKHLTEVWLLPGAKEPSWLQCEYASTSIALVFPVPPEAVSVRVVKDLAVTVQGNPDILEVEYR